MLIKDNKDIHLALFHGATGPDAALLAQLRERTPQGLEQFEKGWALEAKKVLEKSKAALLESGFDPQRLSTVLEERCSNPADAMLTWAEANDVDTVAVGRWGQKSVSRQVIGSVTYKLAQLADGLALWVVDPRIGSHNVLLGMIGAPISRRVVDYSVRYFAHLKESRFTLFHVIPPVPPQYWTFENAADPGGPQKQLPIAQWQKEYMESVKTEADDAKKKLIAAGVPEQNVLFKFQPQKKGIARDILRELEEGDHGILVIGRKGFKDIKEFGLGSKANKLLLASRAFVVCLVS
jgi:nucleotide-binding universal stress UspA family protein